MTTTISDFSPVPHNLVLYRGDTVRMPYRLGTMTDDDPPEFDEPYDLTGVEISAQIRALQDDAEPMAEFDVELLDQTDPDERGMFWIILPASVSAALAPTKTKTWFWDLQVVWGPEDVQTIEAGTVEVDKDTTRAP